MSRTHDKGPLQNGVPKRESPTNFLNQPRGLISSTGCRPISTRFSWYLLETAHLTLSELGVVIATALVQNIPIHCRQGV
jgi:hypothetical protein